MLLFWFCVLLSIIKSLGVLNPSVIKMLIFQKNTIFFDSKKIINAFNASLGILIRFADSSFCFWSHMMECLHYRDILDADLAFFHCV